MTKFDGKEWYWQNQPILEFKQMGVFEGWLHMVRRKHDGWYFGSDYKARFVFELCLSSS